MTTLQDRVRFAEEHLTVADGGKFSTKGRDWLLREFWGPLDGYQLWPVDKAHLCESCRLLAGTTAEHYWEPAEETRSEEHARDNDGCAGLNAYPYWLILLELNRQAGKTTGTAAYVTAEIFTERNESIAYIAGSEDQSSALFDANYGRAIAKNKKLLSRCKLLGTSIQVPKTGSDFQLFATSLAGATGGSKTKVIIDEARAVPASVAIPLMPQIFARNGWRCPTRTRGHTKTNGDIDDPAHPTECSTCGARLEPWSAQVLAMSSQSRLDGGERDWFHDACEAAEAQPEPGVHVFRSQDDLNPKVAKSTKNRMISFFGRIESTAQLIEVEGAGVSQRKGEPFVSESQISAVEDRRLRNEDGGSRPAVAFLDTSETSELTSLVILEDDHREGEQPWHRLVEVRIDVWDPKKTGGIINERMIEDHLYSIVPSFGIVSLRIDDRLRPWAKALRLRLKREAPFRAIVRGCNEGDDKWQRPERRLAWEKLDERILGKTIRLIYHATQRAELRGARRFHSDDGSVDVREPRRRVRHLDVSEGLASCCLMAHEIAQKPRARGFASCAARSGAKVSPLSQLRRGGRMFGDPGSY